MQSFSREREKLPLAGSSHCVFKGDRLSENYLPDSIFAPSVERCGPEMMMVSMVCPGNIHSPFPCKDRNRGKPVCTRYIIWEWIFKIPTIIKMFCFANILKERNQNIIRAMTNTHDFGPTLVLMVSSILRQIIGHTAESVLASKPVWLSKLNICLMRDQGWGCISGRLGTGLASRDAVTRPHVDTVYRSVYR